MALAYGTDEKLKALHPVMDDYAEWYGRVIRWSFYPETHEAGRHMDIPESFRNWEGETRESGFIDKITLDSLGQLHDELYEAASELVKSAFSSNGKPDIKIFDGFTDRYEEFIVQLKRLERDCVQADSGMDADTGLRSAQAMEKDLKREIDRRSRRGKPFCLVLARIDNYNKLVKFQSAYEHKEMLEIISRQIRKCLRSFDDAYRASDSEFVMSLKNTDRAGGSAAVARLRVYLAEENVVMIENGNEFPLTMSYCLADPLPGCSIEDLMANMRSDMEKSGQDADTTVEFFEDSALSRFVKKMDDGKPGHN